MVKPTLCLLLSCILILSVSFPEGTLAWVPPRSAYDLDQIDSSWESVKSMRARLGISYNYKPSLLHEEICRFISEEECKQIDTSLQRHAESHRKRQRSSRAGDNPNFGTIKALILLIQFADHTTDRTLIEQSVIENLWNTNVKRWFSENSQGAYKIEPVVIDWVLTDRSEEYYSFNSMGIVPELQEAMYPALNQLDSTDGWDWSQFDADGDGELDAVVMMHSGYDAVTSGEDCQGRDAMQRIYPHAFTSSGEAAWTSSDGSISLNGYAVASAFDGGFCDGTPFTPGLICHEFMHTLGLIDLYDGTDNQLAKGIGAWDIMSNPYGPDNSGNPGFLSAWSREEVEWVIPQEIEYDGFYVLQPAETSNQVYAIYLFKGGPAFSEYLLIENRQQISFDKTIWDGGLMIYHIDDTADGMKNRGYPGQDGWPANGNHYFCAVLPKDGLYDLEQNVNDGDAGDMWLPGDVLGPGMGGTVFPNTDMYQSGFVLENGITIRVVSQQADNDMVFEVTGLAPAPEGATNQVPPQEEVAATESPVATTEAPTIPEPVAETSTPTPEPVPVTVAPSPSPSTVSNSNIFDQSGPTTMVNDTITQSPTMVVPATPEPAPEPATDVEPVPATVAPSTRVPASLPPSSPQPGPDTPAADPGTTESPALEPTPTADPAVSDAPGGNATTSTAPVPPSPTAASTMISAETGGIYSAATMLFGASDGLLSSSDALNHFESKRMVWIVLSSVLAVALSLGH